MTALAIIVPTADNQVLPNYYKHIDLSDDLQTFTWDEMAPVDAPMSSFVKTKGIWVLMNNDWVFVEHPLIMQPADYTFLQTVACEHGCVHGMCTECNQLFIEECNYRRAHNSCEQGKCKECDIRRIHFQNVNTWHNEKLGKDCICKPCAHAHTLYEHLYQLEDEQIFHSPMDECNIGDGRCILKASKIPQFTIEKALCAVQCRNCLRTVFPELFCPDLNKRNSFTKKVIQLRKEIGLYHIPHKDRERMLASPFTKHHHLCTCEWCIKVPQDTISQENYFQARLLREKYYSA